MIRAVERFERAVRAHERMDPKSLAALGIEREYHEAKTRLIEIDLRQTNALLAMEYGFRACERGENLEAAIKSFRRMMTS